MRIRMTIDGTELTFRSLRAAARWLDLNSVDEKALRNSFINKRYSRVDLPPHLPAARLERIEQ